ncbi:DUF2470 domain-containing protein [Streptomyces sp. CA-111067]|uniref:DUF2470 domain-containing protein n=1 Tax=Streptomyces sp. CA-111067 TaxID=3240046 RepID=UPI003D95BBFE
MIRPGNPVSELSSPLDHGQPRPEEEEAPRQPSAAERARTLVENNSSLALVIPGLRPAPAEPLVPLRRSIGPEGDVFLLFGRDSPVSRAVRHAADDEVGAVLEITDVAPVAVPHRIRGRASVAGWLTGVPGGAFEAGTELVRLEVGEISLDDLWGCALVDPDEFAAAEPDPLAGYEAELLQHLAAAHSAEVHLLCGLVGGYGAAVCGTEDGDGEGEAAGIRAVPLGLDRFGLRVRFSGGGRSFDARFDFPEPVAGLEEARRSMRALFAAARDS